MTWLLYALGGGWGHLTRSVALGRLAARRHAVMVLTNSPYAHYFQYPELHWEVISAETPFRATCDRTQQILRHYQPQCLVVDTFPRGLGGELVDLLPNYFCVLTHRDLNPDYVRSRQLAEFVQHHYALVLIPGEQQRSPLPGKVTAPWLIRNAEELPDWQTARSWLGVNLDEPLVLVLAAGRREELERYGVLTEAIARQFPGIAVRCLAPVPPPTCPPDLWIAHHPALEVLGCADVVVGGAGYNTISECRSLGVPLVALPWERLYDRQAVRLRYWLEQNPWPVRAALDWEGAIAAVGDLLQGERSRQVPRYENGAIAALDLIEQGLGLGHNADPGKV